ncbi:MAG TPA: PAS domain S-box protein [Stellaceae bacterium]|nr:PAS domain S-box protein [Stellaceae bacterium]
MKTARPSPNALAEVLEAIGDAVYAMDRRERILFANRRALELWGKDADAVVGRHLLDVFPGIEDGEPYRAYRAVLATHKRVHLEAVAPALGRWISLDVQPGPRDGLVVVFRDIDDRKRAEAALRESEERFRSMLEALPQMAYVLDTAGNAIYYNREFQQYLGCRVGPEPSARDAFIYEDDLPPLRAARDGALATGKEFYVEARIRRRDGAYRWHRIQNRPMHTGDGRISSWLGTAVDIDDIRHANELLEERVAARTAELEAANRRLAQQIEERQQAEAQLSRKQRVEAIGQLTAGIAHDFNNLLTSIMGNIELLDARLGAVDERSARLIKGALAAAERGANLTAQLLAFARQQRMNPEPVNLNQVISGMATLLHSTIGASIRIELAPAKGLWRTLADVAQLELVLLNLAINSRDAMPHGGTITISTANAVLGAPAQPEDPPAGEYAMVSVADTGGGIPAEIIGKVFDPFFTTKEIGKGSGLGLSQVLGVAQQLGGGVRIETTPGAGTAVKVFLPRTQGNYASRAVRALAGQSPPGGSVPRTCGILLVDDEDEVRAVTASMLRETGHTVVEAGSGGAALEHLDRDDPHIDLLIADLAMPGMSGSELAQAARQNHPDLRTLFVSGFADLVAHEEGVVGLLLQKPFRAEELNAKVAAVLGQTPPRPRRAPARQRTVAAPLG